MVYIDNVVLSSDPARQENEVGASKLCNGAGFVRSYDRRDKDMIRDLINITYAEIDASAARSVEECGTLIMYLQNNGKGAQKLDTDDMDAWIYEDIDE